MGEVKAWQRFYSATVFGDKRVGRVFGTFQKYFYSVSPEGKLSIEQLFGGAGQSNITDLTELEPHNKGTGVWLEGRGTRSDLFNYLRMAKQRAQEKGYGPLLEEGIDRILAQLSPQPEAREEQVSLGEVVKVTIELSEEDAFEARFHDEDLANNRIGEQICYQVAEQLRTLNPLTPPPVELPEVGSFALISDGFIALSVSGDIRGSKANWAVTTHDGGRYFNSWSEIYPHIIRLYTPSGELVTGFEYYKTEKEG